MKNYENIKGSGIRVIELKELWEYLCKDEDWEHVKFKCPSCGGLQSFDDLMQTGHVTADQAKELFNFSCIGRYIPEEEREKQGRCAFIFENGWSDPNIKLAVYIGEGFIPTFVPEGLNIDRLPQLEAPK